jgi:NADH dehydrogenase (ubiquinone) 1 alpha subcomplex subunit 9
MIVGRLASRVRPLHTPAECFSIEKKLFVYDAGETKREGESGINATIFGGSGFMGQYIGAKLGYIGSNLIFPINYEFHYQHAEPIKELKLCASTGKSWIHKEMNYRDQSMIERMINNSNVVVNLVGPRKTVKKREDFEFVNIEISERIAHACKKKGVLRLIHFSAAGAYEDSASQDYQTKAIAERLVLKAFPNATIFRPCPVYGYNDYFLSIIERQFIFFFRKFCIVSDNCLAKKQPISVLDVATCVLNALKLDNTKGKTYELGGPNVFTYLEIYEILLNYLR